MTPRRLRVAFSFAGEKGTNVTKTALASPAPVSRLTATKPLLSLFFRALVAALLLSALHISPLPVVAADPPPKGETIADLRAATDEAIKKMSMGITSAFDELITARWWDREQAENTATSIKQGLPNLRMEATKGYGPPIPRAYEYLGALRTGNDQINFAYVLHHELDVFGVELGFLRLEGKWRMIWINLGDPTAPFLRRFLSVERPDQVQLHSQPNANLFRPASIADLKTACDATFAKLAAGDKSKVFNALLRDHFINPSQVDGQIQLMESKVSPGSAELPKNLGRMLPVKAEFLGLSRTGANSASLHYNQPYERGSIIWIFSLYRPSQAWRLYAFNFFDAVEAAVGPLFDLHPANEPISAADRPIHELVTRMVQDMAKSSPTATEELLRKAWINRDDAEALTHQVGLWSTELPLIKRNLGDSLPNGTAYLGSATLGTQMKKLVYLNLREQFPLPIATTLILRDANWLVANVAHGNPVKDDSKRFLRYEHRTVVPPNLPPQFKSAPSDIAELEKSCARFMTRLTSGKLAGSTSELFQTHPPTDAETKAFALNDEARYQAGLAALTKTVGKPVPGGFEYLGVGRYDPFLARLVYRQHFEGAAYTWVFVFYRVNNEWRTAGIIYPGEQTADLENLQVIERASTEALPK